MDSPISLIVRIIATGYILYRLWRLTINDRLNGLWDWIFRNVPQRATRKTDTSALPAAAKTSALADVVGRTNTVYLEDPRITAPVPPAMSQPLEPSGFIGEETEPSSEEVEAWVAPAPAQAVAGESAGSDDTGDDGVPLDKDFDRCLTFEQMNEAMDVLAGATADEQKNLRAATVIDGVRNSDLYDFFVTHAGSVQAVESLLAVYLDNSGEPLPPDKRDTPRNTDFDMGKYV